MTFTREDILKILNALLQLGRKDSEFKEANTPLNSDDEIAILQDGINKKVSINNLLSTLGLLKKDDFINVSDRYDEYYIQLSEAITIIANNKRKKGLVITFLNLQGNWKIFQFNGEVDNFSNTNYWKDLFDFKYPIVNSVLPDEEDLTLTLPNEDNNSFIKLKDKEYDATNFSGMGIKIIRKNIIEVTLKDGTIKRINYLSSDVFNSENTIYVIQYDFTLTEDITIPANCVLKFDGGSISAGSGENMDTITGNNTGIQAGLVKIFDTNITLSGTWNLAEAYPEWFGAKGDAIFNQSGGTDDSFAIQKAISMKVPVVLQKRGYAVANTIKLFSTTVIKSSASLSTLNLLREPTNEQNLYWENQYGCIKAIDNIDAVFEIYGNHITLEHIAIDCNNKSNYGIKSNSDFYTSSHYFNNIAISDAIIAGVKFYSYLTILKQVRTKRCPTGFDFYCSISGAMTSILFEQCYADVCTIGFKIDKYIYTNFLNCACDHASEVAYKIINSNAINIDTCACEDAQSCVFIANSKCNINTFYAGTKQNADNAIVAEGQKTRISVKNIRFFDNINYQITTTQTNTVKIPVIVNDFCINKFACGSDIILLEPKNNLLETTYFTERGLSTVDIVYSRKGNGYYVITEDYTGDAWKALDIADITLEAGTYMYFVAPNASYMNGFNGIVAKSQVTSKDSADILGNIINEAGIFTLTEQTHIYYIVLINSWSKVPANTAIYPCIYKIS